MQIMIPGALPPHPVALELAGHVEKTCPQLIARMRSMAWQRIDLAAERFGCTPAEALELQQLGYPCDNGLRLGAGLAPFRAGAIQTHESVFLAELCNIDFGHMGAQLTASDALDINRAEADALFDAVADLWKDSPISILPIRPHQWRVWLDLPLQFDTISPQAVQGLALRDWLPQHESLRPWRKLLNEIQTVWHEHPINEARAQRGQRPLNSLWLYGGGHGWKPVPPVQPSIIFEDLASSHARQDWASWLEALPKLSAFLSSAAPDATLSLLGHQHYVELTPIKRSWWQHLLPNRPQNWKSWWNLPN
jgi:hypothetical protein